MNLRSFVFIAAFLIAAPALAQAPLKSVQSTLVQAPSQPAVKGPPTAKTRQEYNDYNAAYSVSGGAAMEKAANDFATKYPASELRPFLYSKAMHEYQTENNAGKMLAMGEKVLKLDPDNLIALVLTATVLADSLSDNDADQQQKVAEIQRNATRAMKTVDTGFTPPVGATSEQVMAYKATLLSMSHAALGIMELKQGKYTQAEADLKSAVDFDRSVPDPYVLYHLALAQDHQKKYSEALVSVDRALQAIGSNVDLQHLVTAERDRLIKLTGATR